MDKLESRVETLEGWHRSGQKQINKLFAEMGKVQETLNEMQQTNDNFISESEKSRLETHEMLELILSKIDAHDKTDRDHTDRLAKTAEQQEESVKDRADIRQQVDALFKEQLKSKAVPVVAGVGGFGYLVSLFLEQLPAILHSISLFMKAI